MDIIIAILVGDHGMEMSNEAIVEVKKEKLAKNEEFKGPTS